MEYLIITILLGGSIFTLTKSFKKKTSGGCGCNCGCGGK